MQTVVLRAFDNYFNANIALTKLRAAGIECYLKDENMVTIDPLLSIAVGGIKLLVREDNLQEASRELDSYDEQARSLVRCPNCGGNNFIQVPKKSTQNFMAALLSWLFSGYAISSENVYQCPHCGYESEELPEIE